MITAHIIVTPKRSVLDPQGEAVKNALHSLGLEKVRGARVGKFIELEIDLENTEANRTATLKKLKTASQDLLSNPVIEDYQLSLADGAKSLAKAKPAKAKPVQADYEGLPDSDEESEPELVRLEAKPKKALKKLTKSKTAAPAPKGEPGPVKKKEKTKAKKSKAEAGSKK